MQQCSGGTERLTRGTGYIGRSEVLGLVLPLPRGVLGSGVSLDRWWFYIPTKGAFPTVSLFIKHIEGKPVSGEKTGYLAPRQSGCGCYASRGQNASCLHLGTLGSGELHSLAKGREALSSTGSKAQMGGEAPASFVRATQGHFQMILMIAPPYRQGHSSLSCQNKDPCEDTLNTSCTT